MVLVKFNAVNEPEMKIFRRLKPKWKFWEDQSRNLGRLWQRQVLVQSASRLLGGSCRLWKVSEKRGEEYILNQDSRGSPTYLPSLKRSILTHFFSHMLRWMKQSTGNTVSGFSPSTRTAEEIGKASTLTGLWDIKKNLKPPKGSTGKYDLKKNLYLT